VSLSAAEIAALSGVPETTLPGDIATTLPSSTPGPPWTVRMSGLLWWHKPRPDAERALPPQLEARRRGVTNAGFVRYADTPVGPYDEVMGAPMTTRGGLLGRVHVPLIAVNSVPSVHAGRAHWALPKVLASFQWDDSEHARVDGDGWWIAADVIRRGRRIPVFNRGAQAQIRPDGSVGVSRVSMRGRGRLVTVNVDVDPAASFAGWLAPGRHRGILLSGATMRVGAPRWSKP
jgi:hypothetical protein